MPPSLPLVVYLETTDKSVETPKVRPSLKGTLNLRTAMNVGTLNMQLRPVKHQSANTSDGLLHTASIISNPNAPMSQESSCNEVEPTKFCSQYVDSMEMCADPKTVAVYFDKHSDWFSRCAQPMKAEPIGQNGYALTIGRFGSYGFVIEPKIGLDLLPQEQGVYRIETIPVPGYTPTGYDVDFRAAMKLIEISPAGFVEASDQNEFTHCLTRVQWHLDLTVTIQFPRFIHRALPKSLIQTTGDRVLRQIVRQVSHRLTRKVLEDFHTSHQMPIPKHSRRWFQRKLEGEMEKLED
ncbi:DUF1997 domain-containing protein [Leptothermofonsia sp. ETS-13]|uniref:DUF1997 domain-containing protein n=1 Tax=Leptothermofonsia sp. ETS-13 TaxID=3035696 RepID=UPI003BA227A9